MEGTIYKRGTTYSFESGVLDRNGVAFGSFQDDLDKNGWGVLSVRTNPKFSNEMQMFAAGYLEGALTSNRIYENYENLYSEFFGKSGPSKELLNWLDTQDKWVKKNTEDSQNLNDYWKQVNYIQNQYNGLVEGYKVTASNPLDDFAFTFLNGVGDLLDLMHVVGGKPYPKWESMTDNERRVTLSKMGHCSAFVKVPGDLSDLWSAHSSWFTYQAMNRIYKHYYLDLEGDFIASRKFSFSSYPGFLISLDDFYIMGNGLTMIQTTNSILNHSLYDLVKPESLLAWQRVRLANMGAKNGEQWGDIVAKYNSGTYNNQYMVIDYNKYKVAEQLYPGTLWVVEQIPGLVQSADMTSQLERGYWASYNIPYFPEIYKRSGYPEFVEKYGIQYSYQMAPRAKIFRRDEYKVVDLESLKDLMRYNNYKNDTYSNKNPGDAICSRFDLEPHNPSPAGCYDTKLTSYTLQKYQASMAINGPTTSHGIPPFTWKQFPGSNYQHEGQPQVYDFGFELMAPFWQ
eukprot:TRINITY_DN9644_c0_g1_i1.p1 TRINITY_DN9644_c0_g1~~TRINITY_DN9644_c0_g1_i1.p1  ORF type:complete len:541 (-),score=112.21 TRINITY_DN9644_c0_g1_i1:31-1566(-)